MTFSAEELSRILAPPPQTAALPGIGGALRARPEDFSVTEIPAYDANGAGDDLLLTLRKRGLTTDQAVAEVVKHCAVDRSEVGVAGLKDKTAITQQWISVPATVADRLASFAHPAIELGEPRAHGNKLRRGHLHGNRFELVIRALDVDVSEAIARTHAKLAMLRDAPGIDNVYGPQRFGSGGSNLVAGIGALSSGRRRRRGDLIVSAGQSALFNAYVLGRREHGLARTVVAGDVLKKTSTGGLFNSDDPKTDQARLEAGELVITGPIFGSKMRGPTEGSDSAELEAEVLEQAGVEASALRALGRSARGTRRALWVEVADAVVRDAPPVDNIGLGPGVKLAFTLPAGSYATVVCRELQSGSETGKA